MKTFLYNSLTSVENESHLIFDIALTNEEIHIHDFYEIIYILSGDFSQTINNHTFTVKRGDLLFIDLDATHSFKSSTKNAYYNVCILPQALKLDNLKSTLSQTLIEKFIQNKNLIVGKILTFNGDERRELEEIFKAMLLEQNKGDELSKIIFNNYLNIIFAKIITKAMLPKKEVNGWDQLDQFIEENLDGDLSLHNLANRCFYNPSYFCRLFKEKHGMSLVEYVNTRKIERAKFMLLNTEKTIEEISNELGYSNVSVFYKNFTKIVKCTPLNFKNNNKTIS